LSGAGYVAVSGDGNYAYTAAYYSRSIAVVNISNPAAPQVVGQSSPSDYLLNASQLVVSGSYLYVISQNRNGLSGTNSNDDGTGNSLVILDISNPTTPTIVGTLHNSNVMFGPHGLAVSGNYAYIAAQGCLNAPGAGNQPCPDPSVGDAFVEVNISDPSNPSIAASISNINLPAPWTGSNALKHACGITVSGNYAYVTAPNGDRLTIIDISDPLHPAIVGSLLDTTHLKVPVDVAVKNGYAYVVNQTTLGSVTVVDVSQPTAPRYAGTLVSSYLNGAYRLRLRGDFAYVAANSANGTAVLDISDPVNPRLAANVSSPLLNRTVGVDVDPTTQYAISTSPWLSTEFTTRPLYPPFPGQLGGGTATGTVAAISLDPTPIDVTITGGQPGSTTPATTVQFAFSATDAVSTFRCALDGGQFSPCTSSTSWPTAPGGSQSYGPLAPGPHTFQVMALDAAGHSATASYSWTITVPNLVDPTSQVLDYFNRSNGGVGTNWSPIKNNTFATMNVSSFNAVDSVTPTPTSAYAWNYWNGTVPAGPNFGPDVEAYATVVTPSLTDTFRVGARVTPATGTTSYTGYFVSVLANGDWQIIQIDNNNGSPKNTTLASLSSLNRPLLPLATGDKIGIRISGSVVTALRYTASSGWSQLGGLTVDTNTLPSTLPRYTGSGKVAVELRAGAIDDFGAGTIAAPANTSPPTVSGTAAIGQQLTATPGTWTTAPGMPAPILSYQWQDCDGNGSNCSPILDATASTYTVQPSDGGNRLAVVVTASNTDGSSQASSAATTVVPQAPVNTLSPSVSGIAAVGQQLQANAGNWSGTPTPTFTYQWMDCDASATCNPIVGATSSSYTIQTGDVDFALQVVVTGSNSAGSGQASSAPTTAVPSPQQAPVNTGLPQISGMVAVGQQLQADPGSWTGTPPPTFTYQWLDCDGSGNNCSAIVGATASSYTIQASDVGSTLEVVVTGSNSAGSSEASSAATIVVPSPQQAPANTLAPSVSGPVAVGQQVQADVGSWTGAPLPTFTYQWQDCDGSGNNCVAIVGATASSYTIQASDGGLTLRVVVTGSNTAGSSQAASAATSVVPQAPVNTLVPQVTGTVAVGLQLQTSSGNWNGTPAPTFTYQWQDCDSSGNNCVAIVGATASSYTIQLGDGGFTLKAVVTGSNTAGSSQAVSAATMVVTKPPTASVLDYFNRTTGIGSKWTVIKSPGYALMSVSANTAVDASSTAYAWNYWNPTTFGPDVEAYLTVANAPPTTDTTRIGARVTVTSTTYSGYFVSISGTGAWSIIRIDNGVLQPTLASAPVPQPLASGDKIAIRIVGSVITALHYTSSGGWTQVLSANDTRYTGVGSVAIEFKGGAFDDFGAG
jgi:hypothetical protein